MSNFITAENSRIEFSERKERILKLIEKTRVFYEQNQKSDEAKAFQSLYANLQDGDFSIVMIGEFSSGKSTLLNALMGERILPSFTNETTATVNFLRHKNRSKDQSDGCVFYSDGTTQMLKDINLDTVLKYVSTKGDNVSENVKHLDLYLESEFLEDGVTLVDSPGLNGIAEGHREITEQQILKSHASIFVFSSDHPGSKTDFEMLNELKKKVKTIIFVLNKIDAIRVEENETPESVIESLKKNYKKQFPEEDTIPEIWPIAAYPALVARSKEKMTYHGRSDYSDEEKQKMEEKSLLSSFENRLMSFLTRGEKARAQMKAPVERVIAVVHETRVKIQEQIDLLQRSESSEELKNQIRNVEQSIADLNNQIGETRMNINNRITLTFKEVQEELLSRITKLKDKKLNEIDNYEDLHLLTVYLEKFESDFLRRTQSIITEIEQDMVDRITDLINIEYSAHAGVLEEKLSSSAQGVKVDLSNHLEISESSFEVGLEEMKKSQDDLTAKIQDLKTQSDQLEYKFFSEIEKAEQKKHLMRKIEMLENKKESVDAMPLPEVERYTEQVQVRRKRGGLFGFGLDVYFGNKYLLENRIVKDDSNLQNELSRRDKLRKETDSKIQQLQRELETLGTDNVRFIEKKKNSIEFELEEMIRKLSEQEDSNREFMLKKKDQEVSKLKRQLRDYCDDASDEMSKELRKYLQKQKKAYVNLILEEIEGKLSTRLHQESAEMKALSEKLDASTSEKQERIIELQGVMDVTTSILEEALSLDAELENMDVDQIHETSI